LIALCRQKSDNNNRMIQLTDEFVHSLYLTGPATFDYYSINRGPIKRRALYFYLELQFLF
jgi:hypothetical protein